MYILHYCKWIWLCHLWSCFHGIYVILICCMLTWVSWMLCTVTLWKGHIQGGVDQRHFDRKAEPVANFYIFSTMWHSLTFNIQYTRSLWTATAHISSWVHGYWKSIAVLCQTLPQISACCFRLRFGNYLTPFNLDLIIHRFYMMPLCIHFWTPIFAMHHGEMLVEWKKNECIGLAS